MNAQRRKQLTEIRERIETALSDLETVREEEQEAFDNMPESLQQGERGQNAESAIDSMQEGCDSLESARDALEAAVNS